MDLGIEKFFDFLITDFDFKGPFSYPYVREYHTDYVRGNLIISVMYEGDFWAGLTVLKNPNPEIETGNLRVVDIDYAETKYYELEQLDWKKKLWNSISSSNLTDKRLSYYSQILKQNPEILEGNLKKLTLHYKLLKMLKLK